MSSSRNILAKDRFDQPVFLLKTTSPSAGSRTNILMWSWKRRCNKGILDCFISVYGGIGGELMKVYKENIQRFNQFYNSDYYRLLQTTSPTSIEVILQLYHRIWMPEILNCTKFCLNVMILPHWKSFLYYQELKVRNKLTSPGIVFLRIPRKFVGKGYYGSQ